MPNLCRIAVIRPLPDERPRQSVANLIGRFENQVKRQPSSSPGSARSLSATSHTSGDSALEEAKERREWPPKSVSPDTRPPIIIPSSSFSRNLAAAQISSGATLESSATQADGGEEASLTPRPSSTASIENKATPVITIPQRQLSIGVTAPTPITSDAPDTAKPTKTPTTAKPVLTAKTPAKPSASKPTPPATGRTPTKHTGTRPAIAPSSAAPSIKPQNSTSPATSSVRKPTKPAPPSSSAPAAAKTPARTTLAPARAKTPSSARSKTPSSGLFAPTAASLAKARNAQPPPPNPTKKVTLSSSAAERLSKPTAASLSRARTPTSAQTLPARSATKPMPAATRGPSTTKPKAGTTGPAVKTSGTISTKKAVVGAAATVAAVGAAVAANDAEPASEETNANPASEETNVPPEENGYHVDENHVDENHVDDSHIDENRVDEHSENVEVPKEEPHDEGNGLPVDSTEAQVDDEPLEDNAPEANGEADIPAPSAEPESHVTDTVPSSEVNEETIVVDEAEKPAEELTPALPAGNDLEDMVNMLESVPISKERPQSIVSIPDEVHEIPDEE